MKGLGHNADRITLRAMTSQLHSLIAIQGIFSAQI